MPSAHTATSDGGTDWVALAMGYWWVILIFGGASWSPRRDVRRRPVGAAQALEDEDKRKLRR